MVEHFLYTEFVKQPESIRPLKMELPWLRRGWPAESLVTPCPRPGAPQLREGPSLRTKAEWVWGLAL